MRLWGYEVIRLPQIAQFGVLGEGKGLLGQGVKGLKSRLYELLKFLI